MAANQNNKTVDVLLKELNNIFNEDYLEYKRNDKPYTEIMKKIKGYKNARNLQDLLYALENKIESQETFLSLESNLWGTLFVILGLFTTIISDLIISNYSDISVLAGIPKIYLISGAIVMISFEVILYIYSIMGHCRKKSKEKCFYKLAYGVLKKEE